MSNDALPIPPVAEADPAVTTAEPAAPIHPADASSDAATETPVTVTAPTELPENDTPVETPVAETPVTETPAAETPAAAAEPVLETPAAEPPASETTVTETTVIGTTSTVEGDAPVADEIAAASPEAEIANDDAVAEAAPATETAPATEAALAAETAPDVPAGSGAPGIDPALISARMTEVVVELESIAASPDVDEAGKHPDDRALTERLRTLEETWRTLITSGVQEPELRARQAAARTGYAAARSRRAEMRAVERARAGETKRALLVEAFALAQLAQGTSLSQLAGRRVGDEAAPPAAPAAAAPEPAVSEEAVAAAAPAHADEAAVESSAVEAPAAADEAAAVEAPAPEHAIADDVVAADATLADTELSPEADATEEAAIEPVDATLADDTVADVVADHAAEATETTESTESTESTGTADASDGAQVVPSEAAEAAVPVADDVTEVAVADGPTEPEAAPVAEPAAAAPVSTSVTIDITAIARRARELQAEWTAAGFAGREVENELHPLFRRYMQVVFDLSRKESSGKSDARRALVTAARELADQAGDDVTNDAISKLVRDAKNLQNQWKAGEAAPPAVESGAWRQFSGALRQVFAARERLSAGAKVEREAIIVQVTALASAKEPMRAMRDLGPLLRRWRESGPVTTPVYESLKLQLDRAASTVRERADSERKRRDAEDAKSQGERAKNASKILREAERSGRGGKRQERPAAQAQAQGALAAALAEAFGRAEGVAEDVRALERTVADVRDRLKLAEAGSLAATTEEVENEQGFTVRRQVIDPGAVNPARLRAELAQAEQALARRQSELQELTSNARGFGISS